MLPVAMAEASSDGVAMLCTSGFVDDVVFHSMGLMDQNQARRYISMKFARWLHRSVWSSLSECGGVGAVCYLRLPCCETVSRPVTALKKILYQKTGSLALYS